MPRKVILVADPGIDTAFAVALALHDPNLDVIGLIPCAGNVPAARACANVHILIDQLDPPKWPRTAAALPVEYDTDGTALHGPDGLDYQNRVTFDEIVPPERIVYRHGGGDDVEPVQFRQTVIFEDLGGRRTRITWRGDFPSASERDRVVKEYGADKGLVQTMARLADYVAAQA